MIALAFIQVSLGHAVTMGWIGAGVLTGMALKNKGHSDALAVSSLVAWPATVALLATEPEPEVLTGPLDARITTVFQALGATLADPLAGDVLWDADLSGLRSALGAADARLGMVDRLLAGHVNEESAAADALRVARDRSQSEIEAVLNELTQLQLQVGLAALAGDSTAVGERLRDLLARTRAMEELASVSER